jgi:peptidyl-prolyl cis-trans isomerase C
MKLKMKTAGLLLAATVWAVTAKTGAQTTAPTNAGAKPASKTDELFGDPVIAKGKGIEIRQSRLDEAIASVKAGAISRGQEINPAQMPLLEKQVFDNLLMNQLLTAKATDADRAKGKEEGDKRFELIKKRASSEEALVKQLKALGLTVDTLHARLIEEAVPQEVLRSKVTITDEQVKKYYEDHPGDFEEPEMVRASHILIMTTDPRTGASLGEEQLKAKRKQIEDLLKRARAGEDFEKLATQYSEDSGSREKGGVYTFPRGQMVAPFEAAAFSLKTNQISEVVTTSYGYHIIKLLEKIPAKKYDFAKVSSDIKDYLAGKEVEKIAPDLYANLRKEANVEITDPQLKTLIDSDAPTTFSTPGKAAPK